MKKALILLLLGCLAFVGVACGGSDDDGGSGSGSGSGSVSGSDAAASGDSDSDFCESARKFQKDFDETGSGSAGEDQAALFKDLRSAIDQLEDEAPDEIEDDVKTVAEAFRKSDDVLKKYDYDFTKVPEEEAEKISLNDPAVTEASNNVESYFEKTCGIDADGDGDTDGNIETTPPTAVDESGTDGGAESTPDESTETTAEGE